MRIFASILLFSLHTCALPALAVEEFILDGLPAAVSQDTVTPGNSTPIPMAPLDSSGVRVNPSTEDKQDDEISELQTLNTKVIKADTDDVTITASALPAGAATAAKQDDIIADLSSIDGKITKADTDDVAVTSSVLPTGAATEAKQDSTITELQDIDAKLPAIGQKVGSGSVSVVIASDQVVPARLTAPSSCTVKQAAITVGTSAVRLTTDAAAPTAGRQALSFMLDPSAQATCYMGSSSVTTSSSTRGLLIFPGATQDRVMDANDYYMICNLPGQTVFIVECE